MVNIVTSSAIEFSRSSGDCACRQIRPGPAGYGSDQVHIDRPVRQRFGQAGHQAFENPTARGPAPTTAMTAGDPLECATINGLPDNTES